MRSLQRAAALLVASDYECCVASHSPKVASAAVRYGAVTLAFL